METDLFLHPIWQIFGFIFGVAAIGLAILIIYKKGQKKSLSYQVETNSPLFDVAPKFRDKIRILYEDQVVDHVRLIEVQILNSGKLPINISDYKQALRIICAPDTRILHWEATGLIAEDPEEETPPIARDISDILSVKHNEVHLQPADLEPGQTIDIKLLVAQESETLAVDGLIQPDLEPIPLDEERVSRQSIHLILTLGVFCAVVIVLLWPLDGFRKFFPFFTLGLFLYLLFSLGFGFRSPMQFVRSIWRTLKP